MKRKISLILSVVIVGVFILWTSFLWKMFSCGIAGSYPCVETWSLNVSEKELIEIIKEIKREHPELQPPGDTSLTDGRIKNWDSTELVEPIDWNTITPQYSYWYYIKFHYSDTNEDVYTWIREEDDPSFTILALDGLSTHIDSLTPITGINMDWKNINRDYNWYANKREISKFENRIVDLIKEKIRSRQ